MVTRAGLCPGKREYKIPKEIPPTIIATIITNNISNLLFI
jgi:hypothetical protein